MRRLHLIELEDQTWFPRVLRNHMTDLLNFQTSHAGVYDSIVPILHKGLVATGSSQILDLCSGGGGCAPRVHRRLQTQHNFRVSVQMSDMYPNQSAIARVRDLKNEAIHYIETPIDATQVPADLPGFRTMFTSFHHFEPTFGRKILSDAVKHNQGIGIFEFTERSAIGILKLLPLLPIALATTPFLKPRSLSRLFFTYLLPLVPLGYLFDGFVSQLRSYTPDELLDLAQSLKQPAYYWEAGQKPHAWLPIKVTYLIGYPKNS